MTRRQFLAAAASAAAVLAGGSVASAYAFRPTVARVPLRGLAAPLRVAFLTDLHYGPYIGPGTVAGWVDATLAEAPDLVLLGGDLVDVRNERPLDGLLLELGRLRAPLGVLTVWGNHDRRRFRDLGPFRAALEARGVRVLRNEGTSVRDDLHVAGIDDLRTGEPDLAATLVGARADAATLLLSHNPDLLPAVPAERVGLTLCGHTHGGQVRLPGIGALATSSRYGRRFDMGWVRAPARGYVSRGLGVGLLPIRVACPPELAFLELVPEG